MWHVQIHSNFGGLDRYYTTFEEVISLLNEWSLRENSRVCISENFEGKWYTRFTMKED